jgi:hypothetical protein
MTSPLIKLAIRFWEAAEAQKDNTEVLTWDDFRERIVADGGNYYEALSDYFVKVSDYLEGAALVVNNEADLLTYPIGTTIIDSNGWFVAQSDYHGPKIPGQPRDIEWGSAGSWFKTSTINFPARVLYIPLYDDIEDDDTED